MSDSHAPRRRNRSRRPAPKALPDDLYGYLNTANDDQPDEPAPERKSPPVDDLTTWRVIDDWPAKVPITEAEIEVFEHYFADVFDRLFGPPDDPETGLISSSSSDNNKL